MVKIGFNLAELETRWLVAGSSENKTNPAKLKLELELSLAKGF